jgi:hypothetical protein
MNCDFCAGFEAFVCLRNYLAVLAVQDGLSCMDLGWIPQSVHENAGIVS